MLLCNPAQLEPSLYGWEGKQLAAPTVPCQLASCDAQEVREECSGSGSENECRAGGAARVLALRVGVARSTLTVCISQRTFLPAGFHLSNTFFVFVLNVLKDSLCVWVFYLHICGVPRACVRCKQLPSAKPMRLKCLEVCLQLDSDCYKLSGHR